MTLDWDVAKAYAESPWEQVQAVPVYIPEPEEVEDRLDEAFGLLEEAPTRRYRRGFRAQVGEP